MKTFTSIAIAVLVISGGVFLVAQAQEHPTNTEHPTKAEHPASAEHPAKAENPAKTGDIIAVASSSSEITTLVKAIQAAGLVEKLQGKGPFTIFAPTDEAFAKLPDGKLEDLLKPANKAMLAGFLACHVVPGKLMAAECKTMKVTNISGQDLSIEVKDDVVTVNDARVVQADLVATNGVIHVIDSVIVSAPPTDKTASEKPKDHPAH